MLHHLALALILPLSLPNGPSLGGSAAGVPLPAHEQWQERELSQTEPLAGADLDEQDSMVPDRPVAAPEPGDDPLARRTTPEVLVARAASPAVVYIETDVLVQRRTFWGRETGEAQSGGSGVVIFDDGYVVTNFHVVQNAKAIRVRFDDSMDRQVYAARLISKDASEDLALLKIESETPFPTVPMGRSNDLMVAEPVIAIGNPYGQSFTVSRGIISGLHRDVEVAKNKFENLIQTDASINPGNSGGPLLNINGELIGINTAMNMAAENIGFAIPVDRVREVLFSTLLQASTWFGIDVDPAEQGAPRVIAVQPGSPGLAAGLQPGDRIVGIDDLAVDNYESYQRTWVAIDRIRDVTFQVERGDERLAITAKPWPIFDGVLYQRFGLRVEPLTIASNYGTVTLMRVTDLRPEGPADRLGLQRGDLVERLRANQRGYYIPRSVEDLAFYARELPERSTVEVRVWRDRNGNNRLEFTDEQAERMSGVMRVL